MTLRVEPSAPIEFRRLNDLDAQAFRKLRLDALREFPEAFGMTYAEAHDTSWPEYLSQFQTEWIAGDSVIFGALQYGKLIGSLGLRRREREKQRHKGYIWIFFVEQHARGIGIGRHLLQAGTQYARRLPELTQIQLSVPMENQSARSLYGSFGFVPFGRERDALKVQDRFVDLELMALQLR